MDKGHAIIFNHPVLIHKRHTFPGYLFFTKPASALFDSAARGSSLCRSQEEDLPTFKSGIFNHKTTGAPLTILFENKNVRSGDYEKQRDVPRNALHKIPGIPKKSLNIFHLYTGVGVKLLIRCMFAGG